MKKCLIFIISCLLLLLIGKSVLAYDIPPMPENGIYDPAGYLSQETIEQIQAHNGAAAETALKPQVAVMVVDTLNGESIETVANQVATTWQVGFAETNAGSLFLIAIEDREYRFEISDVASEYLTDLETYYIGENNKHFLRNLDYDTAVSAIVEDMFIELNGGTSPDSSFNSYLSIQNFEAENGTSADSYFEDRYDGYDYYDSYSSSYGSSSTSSNSDLGNGMVILIGIIGFILRLLGIGGGGGGGGGYYRSSSSSRSSFSSRSSSGRSIGRGGGGFSGRGSSGKW